MRLWNILEDDVDKRYYLDTGRYADHLEALIEKEQSEVYRNKIIQLGNISDSSLFGGNQQHGRIYSTKGVSPTLTTMQGGGRVPMILVEVNE